MPPNIKKNDRPPTKKPKNAQATPEVHIAVNITPTPGMGIPAAVQESYVVTGTSIERSGSGPTPGLCPDVAVRTETCGAPAHTPAGRMANIPSSRETRFLILLDCVRVNRVPSVHELLTLMDIEDPAPDLKYVDALSDLQDFGVDDVLDLFELQVCYLATFGNLRRGGADRLRQFTRDKLLVPLELVEIERPSEAPSIIEIASPTVPVIKQNTHDIRGYDRAIKREQENRDTILEWLSGVSLDEGLEDIEEVREETDTDDADDIEEVDVGSAV